MTQSLAAQVLGKMPQQPSLLSDITDHIAAGDTVAEDLGNLKFIDKDLFPVFKNFRKLSKAFGQNSPVTDIELKNGAAFTAWAKGEIDTVKKLQTGLTVLKGIPVVGAVFIVNGQQVMAVSYQPDGSAEFRIKSMAGFLSAVTGQQMKTSDADAFVASNPGKIGKALNKLEELHYKGSISSGQAQDVVVQLKHLRKHFKFDLRIKAIGLDKKRIELVKERKELQAGVVAVGKAASDYHSEFNRGLRKVLSKKLEAFKMSRAPAVEDEEEFLDFVLKNGYLDRINLAGVVYRFHTEQIHARSLFDKESSNWKQESYMEYEVVETESMGLWSKNYEIRKKSEKFYQDAAKAGDTMAQKHADEFEKLLHKQENTPYQRIRIMLKGVGGAITVDKLVGSYSGSF